MKIILEIDKFRRPVVNDQSGLDLESYVDGIGWVLDNDADVPLEIWFYLFIGGNFEAWQKARYDAWNRLNPQWLQDWNNTPQSCNCPDTGHIEGC